MIKTLIFDNNGVLTTTEENGIFLLSKLANVSKEEFESVWKQAAEDLDDGSITMDDFLHKVANKYGIESKIDSIKKIYLDQYVRNDSMHRIVQKLSQDFDVALLSNFGLHFTEFDKKWRSSETFGDNIFVSAFVRMRKPNQDIFEHVLSEMSIKPDEAVFIDDRLENVEAAKSLGMFGIVFKNEEQFLEELQKITILEKQYV